MKAVAAEYDLSRRIETSHTLVTKSEMIPMECRNQTPPPHHQSASIPNPSGRPTSQPRYPCKGLTICKANEIV